MPQDFQQREMSRREQSRPACHHHHSGAAHWLRTAGILAPLLIGELVKDAEKRWRFTRIASVSLAFISEGLYAHKVAQERAELKHYRERDR